MLWLVLLLEYLKKNQFQFNKQKIGWSSLNCLKHLPSKQSVCKPFDLFKFILLMKLEGFQVSVQNGIDIVSPK